MSDDPLLTWKGRRVRSPGESPQTVARKVPEPPLRPGSLFFVPSPLEGWGLDVLLDRLPAEAAVVVFEKDRELAQRCASGWTGFLGSRAQDPRLFHLEEDSEEAVRTLFRKLPLTILRRCEFLTFSGAWMVHAERYRQIFARLEEGLTRWWSNRITGVYLGPLWVRNLFDNLAAKTTQWDPWPNWGSDVVLVCGAGTTLEEVLPWACRHRSSLRLLAADTALPVLKAWNLVPDAVVCLEAQHANLRDFAGWRGAPVPLFADLTSFPPGTRVFSTPPHWFVSEFADIALWDRWPWTEAEVPRVPPMGSVGVVAAWVAWRLSRGPVILAGLDFSFPPGKTHARGAPALASLTASTNRLRPMEQVSSWERPGSHPTASGWLTTPVMEGYAGVLADQARKESHRTWVWNGYGLPLGLPPWAAQGQVPRGETSMNISPAPVFHGPSPLEWVRGERDRWKSVLSAFEKMNAAPYDEAVWRRLERSLRDIDYITFSFPDPELRRATDWLSRAQTQVRWLLGRLETRL